MMSILPPNTLVHDRYRIVRQLERGGFGAVYEAVDERLNHRVALKQLLRISDRISRQFTREAQLLANLSHPNLPRVTDHFSEPIGQFLVMDFVPGNDLGALLLQRDAPFGLDEVLRWGDMLLDVVHYLHTRQPPVIHRDIKPQNLKLQSDGRIMLLDFGLAKGYAGEVRPPTTESSLLAFTKGFAPPEQVEGTGTDARSDIYALGATLYCLLTNVPPMEAQMRLLAAARQRPDPLRPAHELNPTVPVAVSQVLAQALALDPASRPPSASALRAMLQTARSGAVMPGAATPPPGMPQPPTEVQDEPPGGPPPVPRMPLDIAEPRVYVVSPGGKIRQAVNLTSRGVMVGRAADNDLVLAENDVSGHHLRVSWDGSQATVTDLGSSNGTWLAGRRLEPQRATRWEPRDWLAVGSVWLRLEQPLGVGAVPAADQQPTLIESPTLMSQPTGYRPGFGPAGSGQRPADPTVVEGIPPAHKAESPWSQASPPATPKRGLGRYWLWLTLAAGTILIAALGTGAFLYVSAQDPPDPLGNTIPGQPTETVAIEPTEPEPIETVAPDPTDVAPPAPTDVLPTPTTAEILPPTSVAAVPTPVDDVLSVHNTFYPSSFDPHIDSTTSQIAVMLLNWEGLTRLDKDLRAAPAAAETWAFNEQGDQITFTLREGLRYSDGSPLTSANFRYAVERTCDPGSRGNYQSALFDIVGCAEFAQTPIEDRAQYTLARSALGIETPDERTITFKLTRPAPYFPYIAGLWVMFPAKQALIEQGGSTWYRDPRKTVGNGPFQITAIEADERIRFEANEYYWAGSPSLAAIEYVYIEDPSAALEAYRSGELDILTPDPSLLPEIADDPELSDELIRYSGANTYYLEYNWTKPPFDDPKVRQAFSMAFDRDTFCAEIRNGACIPTLTWIPEGIQGHTPTDKYGFDPDGARQALAESTYGGPSGVAPIQLVFSEGDAATQTMYEWMASQFQEILGVEVTVEPMEPDALGAAFGSPETYPMISLSGWIQDYPDPQNWLSIYWTCNASLSTLRYCNEEFDQLIGQADQEFHPVRREQLYQEATQILIEDQPGAFLYHEANIFLVKPYVTGYNQAANDLWPGSWTSQLEIDIGQ